MPLNRTNNTVFGTVIQYATTGQTEPMMRMLGINNSWLNINQYGYIAGSGAYGTSNTTSPQFDLNGNFTVGYGYFTGEVQANTLKIGTTSNTENYISFRGTTGDEPGNFSHTFIGERVYGGIESSELLLLKGNDNEGVSGPDRIRLFSSNHVFDTYAPPNTLSGTFSGAAASAAAVTRMIIKENGNIGIGTISPNTIGSSSSPAMLGIVTNAVSTVGLVVKGIASQTAALQQWQNSTGQVIASISPYSEFFILGNSYFAGAGDYGARINVDSSITSKVGIVVRGQPSQTANLQEWQNSAGTTLLRVSSDGYLNKTGTLYIGPQLSFADPGIGNETKFVFQKASDGAWITVKEKTSDNTFYEFGMSDNALDGGDYFQWSMSQWAAPGYGWMPLQLGSNSGKSLTLRFAGDQSIFWSQISTPVNSPYFTALLANSASTDFETAKYYPDNGTTTNIKRLESTGSSATFNVDLSGYTYPIKMGYRITIDAGATTFSYTTYGGDNSSGTAIAINAGNWVTLSNGAKIRISAGALAGENWSFLAFPTPRVAIGGAVDTSTLTIIRPAPADKGLIIKGSSGQTANLQEWQSSSGYVLASVNIYGGVAGTYAQFTSDAATTSPLMARGSAGQTANLTSWIDSSGTVLAKVDKDGNVNTTKSFVQTGTIGTTYAIDASGNESTYAANATVDFPNFSGMILIDCQNDGALSLWLCGGGSAPTRIGGSKTGANDGTMAANSGINGYTWTNANVSQTVNITAIRTRAGA